ncbi:MAG: Bifunctional protein: zinc-containing alcohol dehydrogenase; quinone oxidoreductase (NADPH:quinone reductase); Similar to arginate lyase [uncultured Chthoniobacterales bacterium]|uniref:Bifunctional protein: zinc-containing alcohol dehydrogenase quinone oxidoreductase ( NADPH:quinone reductase) Similar to arginate lyase n=1 Tax=uncultured Chthoniobacterales bacterium TaxID=1836801 RepID=A0A6J4IEU3_9BACT|nr:MAG: Bifunctional protein: zinc-containing alcohol dehydrogenase; quinone oxidoreductase (NADPH:quinone reductase); Similar to arginate lyase [uncultured Chthoniobacterales bacterium]
MKIKRVLKWSALAIVLALFAWFQVSYWTSTNDYEQLTAAQGETMQAVVYRDYGSPDVLKLETIAKPVPTDAQVLVKVRAASVNPLDWHFMRGEPRIMRIESGLRKPKGMRMGVDFSGLVEAVGKNVTQFKPGDEVFGGRTGSFAEYVVIAEQFLIPKPQNISFEQAGAVQIAGLTALQGLRDSGKLQPGQKVLINGASGGVGTFAVQIAKTLGAEVTGVCSTRNVDMVRSLGADHVIDYTKEDFTKGSARYDVVLDLVGNHGLLAVRRALTAEGKYVMIGGPAGGWIAPMDTVLRASLLSMVVKQEMGFMMSKLNRDDLMLLRDLMAGGKVTPVIDKTYPLSQTRDAVAYQETGRARGKVVITMTPEEKTGAGIALR